ncbi:armadillo-type protein [Jimgerdemannia flammicorona]|uniref:Armadillo-type protein n=1 Tax=Jimgerdemannia flammicorona TaxID=994334 RepID=A0A432ZZH8_9FUNG|nr:armadillo-type protein [Jimgerdemannia flammicorona]
MFRELVPGMVNVLQQCLTENDEDNASKGFEVFDTLLMLEIPLLSTHLAQLIDFFLNVGANQQYDGSIRIMALSFLMWAAVYKQNKLRTLKLVGPIVQRVMPIGTEEDPEDVDDDSPSRLAFKVMNALATNMPPQQVFPIVIQNVVTYMQNPDPNYRKAAMMTFAVVIEGCADYMRPKFSELLPIVCAGLQDPDIIVRRAACMALSCLAGLLFVSPEDLESEIAENHATLLPLVFNLMNDVNPEVTKHACNALDAILEGLGEDVLQYLPVLMEKLLHLLDNAPQSETKATVTAALGSAAHAAGEEFQPYFVQVMPRLLHIISLKSNPDELLLRGVAIDTVGAVAEAVGKDMFRPHVESLMNLAMEGMQLESSRLRECSYCFYSILARVFEDDFAPYLSTIMPHLIASCQAEEKDEFALEGEIDLTTDAFEDEDEALGGFNFNSAIADEKEIAADALGELFENTKVYFLPYVEQSMTELVQLSDHISEGVRKAVVGSLFNFLKTFSRMSNPAPFEPGLPLVRWHCLCY